MSVLNLLPTYAGILRYGVHVLCLTITCRSTSCAMALCHATMRTRLTCRCHPPYTPCCHMYNVCTTTNSSMWPSPAQSIEAFSQLVTWRKPSVKIVGCSGSYPDTPPLTKHLSKRQRPPPLDVCACPHLCLPWSDSRFPMPLKSFSTLCCNDLHQTPPVSLILPTLAPPG
jgi:hypothetical protein